MVTLEEAVTARLKTHGAVFEVLVDPEGAMSFRQGDKVEVEKILAAEDVFENASRGDRSSEEDLLGAFETTDVLAIAAKIIKKGEIQLTAEQRKRIIENKRRQVVHLIAMNAINPQTGTPHPPARIERAMEEAHVHVDPTKSVEEMVNITMKAIRPLIPIRFEEVDVAVKIPPAYAPKAYGEVATFGKLQREQWQNDGSWIGVVRIPAGLQNEFYSLVNRLSKGDAETKLLKR
ncbi:ribosome assembly factor SBDS [Methanotrichaceae archaeon M04Ac]|uniref:Ribosome assembly factor SBDS n=1 Tax=Candidatus Methanocrinis alkalitolerans TaxID=3033395 RepID=A0ABT5XCS8_9EURY|nr:ribosome assembly factor SBDS [Candidatus Methanocrinis alkalitolerans]MCR3883504.1 ribosome assembly factor SBDS [Methanothrix sp.]MDF0592515.1 ribosome assembly factor SBDS [Candidatus Methanocrinis alkalitolerans]